MKKRMLKKALALLACIAVLASCLAVTTWSTAFAAGDDLVVLEENFESGTAEGWVFAGDAGSGVSSEAGCNSDYGVSIQGAGDDYTNIVYTPTFKVSKGATYILTYKLKGMVDGGITCIQAKGCKTEDPLSASGNSSISDWPSASTEWQDKTYTFTIPTDYARDYFAVMFVRCAVNQYIDDVKIVQVVSNDGYITNGDFELGNTAGMYVEHWWDSSYIRVDAEAAKDSNFGLRMEGEWSGKVCPNNFAVEQNTDYVLSFDLKASDTSGGLAVYVRDGAGNGITETWPSTAAANTWEKVSINFNSGDATEIALEITSSGNNIKYIDNLAVAKANVSFDGYITNGDFELGKVDPSFELVGGTSSVTKDAAKDGLYGVKISGESWGAQLKTVPIKVEPQTAYMLTYDLNCVAGDGAALYIHGTNAEGTAKNTITDDWPRTSANSWETKTKEFSTGDYEYIFIEFNICDAGDKYIDNVSLKKMVASDDGYITNGDFELGKFEGVYVEHWWDSSYIRVDTEAAKDGSFGMRMEGEWSGKFCPNNFAVEQNTDYILSFDLKASDTEGGLAVYVRDGAGNGITETWPVASQANTWENIQIPFNSGAAAEIALEITSAGNNVKYIDNITVKPAPQPGEVINADFETGDNEGWKNNGSGSTVTADAAKDGDFGMHLKGGYWDGFEQIFLVKKNTVYRVFFDFKDLVGWKSSAVYIKGGSNNGPSLGEAWPSGEKDVWSSTSITVGTGDNDHLYLQFCVCDGEKYIDNIRVVELGQQVGAGSDVTNGDFEAGTILGWAAAGTSDVTDTEAHSGQYSLMVNGPTSWTAIKQTLSVEKNTDYLLTFWGKAPTGSGLYKVIGQDNSNLTGDLWLNSDTADWQCYKASFNSGDNTEVTVDFEYVEDVFYIDDVRVLGYRLTDDKEILANADFEEGWLYGYGLTGGGQITSDVVNSGEHALVLNGSVNGGRVFKKVNVTPNTNYHLSFYANVDGLTNSRVSIMDYTNAFAITERTLGATEGWEKIDVLFNSGENDVVYIDFTYVAGGVDAYIDDISFVVFDTDGKDTVTDMYLDDADQLIAEENIVPEDKRDYTYSAETEDVTAETIFTVPVEKDGVYALFMKVKGSLLSAANRGNASFGVANPDTGDYLLYLANTMSTVDYQLSAPAWDDEWHTVSLVFQAGQLEEIDFVVKAGAAAFELKDITIAPLSKVSYAAVDGVSLNEETPENLTPKAGTNLLAGDDKFLAETLGYGRHVLYDSEKAVLNAKGVYSVATGMHYFQLADVEANTDYIVAFDFNGSADSMQVGLLDDQGNKMSIGLIDTEGEWFEAGLSINTGDCTSLAFYIADTGAELSLSNLRLFKASDVDDSIKEPESGESNPSEDPDKDPDENPETGVPVAVLPAALFVIAGLAVLVLYKKRQAC